MTWLKWANFISVQQTLEITLKQWKMKACLTKTLSRFIRDMILNNTVLGSSLYDVQKIASE